MNIPKKNYALDVIHNQLSDLELSTFKYLLNKDGLSKSSKCINAIIVLDNGIMLKIQPWEC